jgi:hypothetical protein
MQAPIGRDKRLTITDEQLGVRQVILLGCRLDQGTSLSINIAYDTRSEAETMLNKRLYRISALSYSMHFSPLSFKANG